MFLVGPGIAPIDFRDCVLDEISVIFFHVPRVTFSALHPIELTLRWVHDGPHGCSGALGVGAERVHGHPVEHVKFGGLGEGDGAKEKDEENRLH